MFYFHTVDVPSRASRVDLDDPAASIEGSSTEKFQFQGLLKVALSPMARARLAKRGPLARVLRYEGIVMHCFAVLSRRFKIIR